MFDIEDGMLACRPNVSSNGVCPVVSRIEVLYPMHISFKFSFQSFCRSVVQVRIRSFNTACVRSGDPIAGEKKWFLCVES